MIESLLYNLPRAHETTGSSSLRYGPVLKTYPFQPTEQLALERAQKNQRARVWFALSACSAYEIRRCLCDDI